MKKRIFRIITKTVLALILCSNIKAQITITGTIYDDVSKKALQGVAVSTCGSDSKTISDDTGNFVITVKDTSSFLVFNKPMYKEYELKVGIRKEIDVYLSLKSIFDAEYDFERCNSKSPKIIWMNRDNSRNEENPSFIVNGIETTAIKGLNPKDVDKISMLKDNQVDMSKYPNGLIIISLKSDVVLEKIKTIYSKHNIDTTNVLFIIDKKIITENIDDYEINENRVHAIEIFNSSDFISLKRSKLMFTIANFSIKGYPLNNKIKLRFPKDPCRKNIQDIFIKYVSNDTSNMIYMIDDEFVKDDIINYTINVDSVKAIEVYESGNISSLKSLDKHFIIANFLIKSDKYDEDQIRVKKPVIYIYSDKEKDVNVQVDFKGEMTATYPEYPKTGWDIRTTPDGGLINKKDNRNHRYLYWEGNYEIEKFSFPKEMGFVVAKDSTISFLERTLAQIGLSPIESNDFISYWLPDLYKNKFNYIHFLIGKDCDPIASLNIKPAPETEIRVYMLFEKCDSNRLVEIQKFETLNRSEYTVVEWGGAEIGSERVK